MRVSSGPSRTWAIGGRELVVCNLELVAVRPLCRQTCGAVPSQNVLRYYYYKSKCRREESEGFSRFISTTLNRRRVMKSVCSFGRSVAAREYYTRSENAHNVVSPIILFRAVLSRRRVLGREHHESSLVR